MLKFKDYLELDVAAAFLTWLSIAGTALWVWSKTHGVDTRFIIATLLFVGFWLGFSGIACDRRISKNFETKQLVILTLMYSMICALYFTLPIHTIAILGVIWAALLSYLRPRFLAYLLVPIGMIPYFLSREFYWEHEHFAISMLLNTLFQFFALMTFERMRFAELAEAEAKQLNRELQATQALVKAMSEQSERLRISRDLHDTLGHHLTALSLNLQVASHLAEGEVKEKVEQSFAISKLLLSDVRETVSHLRDEADIDIREAIKALVTGIQSPEIELVMDTDLEISQAHIAETLFRCVQEALTNVLRHSAATGCQVMLAETPTHWLLRVQDNGAVVSHVSAGNGLTGMSERVAAVGGELVWSGDSSGFVINVAIQKEMQ